MEERQEDAEVTIRDLIIKEWQESAKDAIERLESFIERLDVYAQCESVSQGAFLALLKPLINAGLDGWAGGNPCGGGLDVLKAVVCVEELPEKPDLLTAIFGEAS